MSNAFEELLAFQRALKDMVASVDATYAKQHEEFFIGLEGSFGAKHVTPALADRPPAGQHGLCGGHRHQM